jgi:hypothetical protein
MLLFGGVLAVLLLAMPYGCSRKAPGTTADTKGASPGSGAEAQDLVPDSPRGFDDTLTLGGKYQALIAKWGGDLSTARAELGSAKSEIEALKNALAEDRARQDEEKKQFLSTLERLRDGLGKELGARERGQAVPDRGEGEGAPGSGALRAIRLSSQVKGKDENARAVRIPTASGAAATLMNGVFAPTSGEPSPVRLRLDAALVGPNRSRIGLRNAFLIGKAQGDPNSSRVLVQVDRMSYVSAEGKAIESRVLGYVVGEDGLEGVPGHYEWRAADLVPLAALSSGISGASEALALGEVTRGVTPLGGSLETLSGDALKFAGFRGASGASSKVTEILVERMREIRPAVSSPAGGQVTVVFLEGVTLEGLSRGELEDATDDDPFRGLDIHR